MVINSEQKQTRRRILEISYKLKLSHLGSCLSAIDLIDGVYKIKNPEEKFVLSNGHAGIALYVVLEKYGIIKDSSILKSLHVHPDRNPTLGIHVSTGSLGHGLPIALGMALANRNRNIYCMLSDGETAEGSIWETLRVALDTKTFNLKIVLNVNGWGAYSIIPGEPLKDRLKAFGYHIIDIDGHNMISIEKSLGEMKNNSSRQPSILFARTTVEQFPFLKGQDAHYYVMTERDFIDALDTLIW